jgi:hypothetical protein
MAQASGIDWSRVGTQIADAVSAAVHGAWTTVPPVVEAQLQGLVAAGQRIEAERDSMKQAEYDDLKQTLSSALQFTLLMSEGVGLVVAQQAAAAGWTALVSALKAAYPAIGLVL